MNQVDVTIVDYEVGNIASVANMLRRLGYSCDVRQRPEDILTSNKLVLPGVGAFDAGMTKLQEHHLVEPLRELAFKRAIPILGICLGAQLLGKGSEEGNERGLGWLDFNCQKFKPTQTLKVPHMGWNQVVPQVSIPFTQNLNSESRFYFVHSYYMDVRESSQILFKTLYGREFVSGAFKDNIYGVQFHPEKSHRYGLQLMKNFMELR